MAHRNQEFRETCVICRDLSSSECARCSRPLCKTHGHGDYDRCRDCEEDFSLYLPTVAEWKASLAVEHRQLASAFAAWISVFVVPFLVAGPLGGGSALLVGVGIALAGVLNHKRLRRKITALRAKAETRERAKFLGVREPKLLEAGAGESGEDEPRPTSL